MEEEIELIRVRNKRVETDKAWETSKIRRIIIAIMTYFIIVIFLFTIDASNPWLISLVPTMGYLLSTLTLPMFKKWWVRTIHNK